MLNSEYVEILKVIRDVRTRTKVKDCSKSKVLNTLEFCKIGRKNAKEVRIALIEFRGDNRMKKSRSSLSPYVKMPYATVYLYSSILNIRI